MVTNVLTSKDKHNEFRNKFKKELNLIKNIFLRKIFFYEICRNGIWTRTSWLTGNSSNHWTILTSSFVSYCGLYRKIKKNEIRLIFYITFRDLSICVISFLLTFIVFEIWDIDFDLYTLFCQILSLLCSICTSMANIDIFFE